MEALSASNKFVAMGTFRILLIGWGLKLKGQSQIFRTTFLGEWDLKNKFGTNFSHIYQKLVECPTLLYAASLRAPPKIVKYIFFSNIVMQYTIKRPEKNFFCEPHFSTISQKNTSTQVL